MTETPAVAGPVPQTARIAALDVARGVAVLGILIMNIWAFAGPQAFFDYPLAIADRAGAPVATWAVVHTLFEGSQRALLSVLFGAGALLFMSRFEGPGAPGGARGLYLRRTLLLSALGLINAYLFMWPADILFVYGLAGLCLYPLRHLSAGRLLLAATLALGLLGLQRGLDLREVRQLAPAYEAAVAARTGGATLSAAETAVIADWEKRLAKARPDPASEDISRNIRQLQTGSLGEVFVHQAKVSLILQTIVMAKWWFLDALAGMLIGMALYRAGLLTRPATAGRYLALAGAGFAVGLPLSLWQTGLLLSAGFDPVAGEVAKLGYDIRRLAMAMGYLGLILWFCQQAGGAAIRVRLAAVGRLALTNYLAQSILCALLFYGFGFGLYGRLTGFQLYGVVAGIWALELLWSPWWLARFRLGPFEWLWRSLTYRNTQDLRTRPAAELT